MQRIAKVAQEYAQRQIKVGETFDVEPQDVHLLLTIGRIEPVAGETGYVTRDMTAAAKRTYQRKSVQ